MTDLQAAADTGSVYRKKLGRRKKIVRSDGRVDPFPMRRFLDFIKVLRVQTKDYGMIPLKLLGSQSYVLEELAKGLNEGVTTFVILKARQLGMSTLFLALDLFWAFEYPGLLGVFATHEEGSRDQFRNQIDLFLTSLPRTHRVEEETNNKYMLVLNNSSLFRYLVAGTRSSTNKMGRSGGCNYCHATETAFWGSAEDVDALMQTFSELYKHRMYVFESTANGFNHFADMWETAVESPAQRAIFVGWWRDERNEFGEGHPLYLKYMPQGEKTPLSTLERERVKEVKRLYDFDITSGQMAWYRCHLENKCGNDQQAMDQEQPWTAEMAFVATGQSFFDAKTLTEAAKEARKFKCKAYMIRLGDRFEDSRALPADVKHCNFKIWEEPSPYGRYAIGGDPIFGSRSESDTGVITVYRCYADGCDQVAEFASRSVSTFQFAWTLAFIAGLYRDSYLALEMQGPGTAVFEELKQLRDKLAKIPASEDADLHNCLRYMKDFLYRRSDSLSGGVLLQWQSSSRLREQLLESFQIGLVDKRVRIKSLQCLEEAKFMVREEDGYIGAPRSKHDDRVFGAALGYRAWDKMVRPRMTALGQTRENELSRESQGGATDPVQGMVERFLRNANIKVPG